MEKRNYNAYRKKLESPLRELDQNTYLVEDSLFIEESDHYPAQLGLVGDVDVLSVEKLDRGYKLHLADKATGAVQSINWADRLQFMQFSLCRVLYSLAFNHLLSIKTLNFYIKKDRASLLLDARDLPYSSLDRIENLVAHTIQANLLVSQTKIDQGLLIRVADYPLQKSQGPHTLRTGEIGFSRITKVSRTDQGLIVDFICGQLAHREYLQLSRDMADLSEFLRCSPDQVKDQVKRRIIAKGNPVEKEEAVPDQVVNSKADLEEKLEKDPASDSNPGKEDTDEKNPGPDLKPVEEKKAAESPGEDDKSATAATDPSQNKEEDKADDKPEEAKAERTESNESSSEPGLHEDQKAKVLASMVKDFKAQASEVDGLFYIYRNLKDISLKELKEVSAKIMDEDDYIQIYGLPSPDISPFLVCLSKNRSEDVKKIFDQIKPNYHLEGGGNYLRVQGSVATKDLPNVMEQFLAGIQAQIEEEHHKES